MLKIRALSKRLGHKLVLDDVNLEIPTGSIFGLIGPNGAGKSTLLRVIAGIYKADLGSVSIDDKKVYDEPECKKDILLISDEPFYFFNANLHEMKEFYQAMYPQMDEEVYYHFIRAFNLDEFKSLHEFSKGMKRQSFLIIGLAIAPKYLLLDEAFDGLDPVMRLSFKRAVAQRIEEKEMSVIISSHNLRELEDFCDHFGMLEQGKVLTSGEVEALKGNIHKIQMAFSTNKTAADFAALDILSIRLDSRVVNLVVRGDIAKIENYLKTMEPLLLEILEANLEEAFIYEMERKGYGQYE